MAEQWASSCSKADIESAISIVKSAGGGTVHIPEGSAEHTGENIKVSGKVSLIGQGKTKTIISRNSGPFFNYDTRFYGGAGESPRVSGMLLQNLSSAETKSYTSIYLRGVNNFRIDNCHIKGYFTDGIHIQGSYGVVDHCDIEMMWGSAYDIRITGYDDEWVEDIDTLLGSQYAVFIEDCTLSGGGHQIATSGGATHYVLRHCTLNLAGSSAVDAHGPGWGPDFGSRCVEIYDNVINRPSGVNIGIRGGGGVIYNNTLNGKISLVLESGSSGDYPVPMQVHDLWIWNNDVQIIEVTSWGGTGGLVPSDYIKENRDYWLTQKSYAPYTYPHPLVGGSSYGVTVTPSLLSLVGSLKNPSIATSSPASVTVIPLPLQILIGILNPIIDAFYPEMEVFIRYSDGHYEDGKPNFQTSISKTSFSRTSYSRTSYYGKASR